MEWGPAATSTADRFSYAPLPTARSVRLLELHPPRPDGGISFTLRTTTVETAPPYDALSYTWGNPASPYIGPDPTGVSPSTPSLVAQCNGKPFPLQENLRDALRMLQRVNFSAVGRTISRHLWADAICIDQTNLSERAAQVRLMGEIFHRARKVVSWLGPEDETSGDASVVVENLSTISPDLYNCVSMEDLWRPEIYPSKLGILPLTPQHWLAWIAFVHRPYFSRVWIVQEMAVAEDILFVCGSRIFPWSMLSAALRFVVHSGWGILLHTEQIRINQVVKDNIGIYSRLMESKLDPGQSAWTLFNARDAVIAAGRQWQFASLLSNHRYCECTDPRDMVYALQGVARKGHRPFDSQPQLLEVDYQISVQQLYTRTAKGLLRAWGDLGFLAEKEGQFVTRIAGLPSWVPDYSAELLPQKLVKRGPDCNWCAAGALQWKQDDRDLEDRLLGVQGMFVGAVEAMAADPTAVNDNEMDMLWASVCEVANGLSAAYSLRNVPDAKECPTRVEVLWRTLVADIYQGQHPAPRDCGQEFMAHLCALMNRIVSEKTPERRLSRRLLDVQSWKRQIHQGLQKAVKGWTDVNFDPSTGPWCRLIDAEPDYSEYNTECFLEKFKQVVAAARSMDYLGWSQAFAQFRRESNLAFGRRRVMRTDGGLLGLGPTHMCEGDQVWVLAGANTPVVLRVLDNGRHQFLGEAYVHGIMHGEAVDLVSELTDITLE